MSRLDPLSWSRPRYPHRPGHVHGSATSRAASDSITDRRLSDLHEKVLALFRQAGPQGLTDVELQAAGNTDSVLRPRRIELTALGKIKASGRTRLTGSNRAACVWELA